MSDEHLSGCFMWKPRSQNQKNVGRLKSLANAIGGNTWKPRWVWTTKSGMLNYGKSKNTSNAEQVVPFASVKEVRKMENAFMVKQGCPAKMAGNGWLLRTETKDVLWACATSVQRDRYVEFFKLQMRVEASQYEKEMVDALEFARLELNLDTELPDRDDALSSAPTDADTNFDLDDDDIRYDWSDEDEPDPDSPNGSQPATQMRRNSSGQLLNSASQDGTASLGQSQHGSPPSIGRTPPVGAQTATNFHDVNKPPAENNNNNNPQTTQSFSESPDRSMGRTRSRTMSKIKDFVTGRPRSESQLKAPPPSAANLAQQKQANIFDDWEVVDPSFAETSSRKSDSGNKRNNQGGKNVSAGPMATGSPKVNPTPAAKAHPQRAAPMRVPDAPLNSGVSADANKQKMMQRLREGRNRVQAMREASVKDEQLEEDEEPEEAGEVYRPKPAAPSILPIRTTREDGTRPATFTAIPLSGFAKYEMQLLNVTLPNPDEGLVGVGLGDCDGLPIRLAGSLDQHTFGRTVGMLEQAGRLHVEGRQREGSQIEKRGSNLSLSSMGSSYRRSLPSGVLPNCTICVESESGTSVTIGPLDSYVMVTVNSGKR